MKTNCSMDNMRRHLLRAGTLTAAIALFPALSSRAADPPTDSKWYNGIYLSINGGGQFRDRAAESAVTFTDWDPGWAVSGALGYEICKYFRAEVEGAAFHNSANRVAGPLPFGDPHSGSGDATLRAVMVNGLFQYPIKNTRWTPYIGGGLGFYTSYLENLTNPNVAPFGVRLNDASPERFAFQLKTGISYALTRWLDMSVGYRYFQGDKLKFYFDDYGFGAGPKKTALHCAEVGLRFKF